MLTFDSSDSDISVTKTFCFGSKGSWTSSWKTEQKGNKETNSNSLTKLPELKIIGD